MSEIQINIDTEDQQTFRLQHALLVYSSYNGGLVTKHDVRKGKILPGNAIDIDELTSLLDGIQSNSYRTDSPAAPFLPDNILQCGPGALTWICRSAVRPIYFNIRGRGEKKMGKLSGKSALWPNLIFKASRSSLSVWAVKSGARPKPSSQLFTAPFFNVYDSGNICMGTSTPKEFGPASVAKWEDTFFMTSFAHTNYREQKILNFKGGHNAFWSDWIKQCRAKKAPAKFANEILVPTKRTLGDII